MFHLIGAIIIWILFIAFVLFAFGSVLVFIAPHAPIVAGGALILAVGGGLFLGIGAFIDRKR
jgi:hypothetical protein